MDILEFRDYCLSLPLTEESTPFDETTLVYKIGGRMYAYAGMDDFSRIAVKCDPDEAVVLRETYPESHLRGTAAKDTGTTSASQAICPTASSANRYATPICWCCGTMSRRVRCATRLRLTSKRTACPNDDGFRTNLLLPLSYGLQQKTVRYAICGREEIAAGNPMYGRSGTQAITA